MTTTVIFGSLLAVLAGITAGTSFWPMKVVRRFRFEQSWFVGMLAFMILPWLVTLTFCPNAMRAYASVDPRVLILSNLFSLIWGVANILFGLCVGRIGVGLTSAFVYGLGISVGVAVPMIFKASGLFSASPDLGSAAGISIICGCAVILAGLCFATAAGFGRDESLKTQDAKRTGFAVGFLMAIIAGTLSSGISFSFVYAQGPIVAAMKAQGASEIAATTAVWSVGLLAGTLSNVVYPAYLMTKNKNWSVLWLCPKETAFSMMIGIQFIAAMVLFGQATLALGKLGASVGWGIMQSMQIVSANGLGLVTGEWQGVLGRPRRLMYAAIIVLVLGAAIVAFANNMPAS